MKDMDLFGDNRTSFEEVYKQFVSEINPSYAYTDRYYYYHGIDIYFKRLYEEGSLTHSELLDGFIRSLYTVDQEEFDISYGYYEAQKICLLNGVPLEKVHNEKRNILEAVASLYKKIDSVDIEKGLCIARLLFDSNCNRFMRYSTSKGYLIKESASLSIYKVYEMLMRSGYADEILALGLDIFDTYSVAAKCAELYGVANSLEIAKDFIKPFVGKEYLYEVANVLGTLYGTNLNDVPVGDDLWDLMVLNELKDSFSEFPTLLNYYNVVKAYPDKCNMNPGKWYALVNSVYNTGFSISYMQRDCYEKGTTYFCELALLADRATQSFNSHSHWHRPIGGRSLYKRSGVDYYYYNKEQYDILCCDKLLDLFRYVYDNLSLNQICNVTEYDYVVDSLLKWLGNMKGSVQLHTNGLNFETIIRDSFSEIQIFVVQNGRSVPAYHIPADFFVEYQNEIERTIKDSSPKVCSISVKKLQQENKTTQSLVLVFSDSSNVSYELQSAPLSLYCDVTVKRDVVFGSCGRVSTPILKKMLYQLFKDHGKDTSALDSLDAQTIVALVSALILQDAEDYKQLFNMQNSFLNGFKLLKWFIRADDNFYSAVLRYILAAAGTHSYYSNNKISKDLAEFVYVGEQKYSLMQIFQKDTSLITYLKTNNCMLTLKGDVIYIA